MICSYKSAYGMSFCPLLDKLEWSDYNRLWVEADSSRWKPRHSRQMSACLHNQMDANEVYAHYRWGICNNRKTCLIQQLILNNTIIF
jgi:hypothetical protein